MITSFDIFYIDSIEEKDAWNLCDLMTANEDRFKQFFPGTLAQNLTPELSAYFTKKKVKEYHTRQEFLFTIKEQNTNALIGLVYIKELDWDKKQGEFAYCIGYQFENKGIISKATVALSKYAFEELGLQTLQIIVHKTNLGSVKVAEKCNFVWQKTLLKEYTPPNEAPLDMELYELYKN
jgi:ribosomal-protein-alanine N-acetyltransferase